MTEKDYNPEQKNKKVMNTQKVVGKVNESPVKKETAKIAPEEKKIASPGDEGDKEVINNKDSGAIKTPKGVHQGGASTSSRPRETSGEVSTRGKKQPVTSKVKKSEAIVNGVGLPLSTKTSVAICKFIRGKSIPKAIANLEQVIAKKKAVPMKGEIPHRKGKIMSGRFPKNAAEYFIKLLKNLQANANANGLDEPVVAEAMANIASQPYGRFGRVRRKRTHVLLKAKDKKMKGGNK